MNCSKTASNNAVRDPVQISNPMYNADYRAAQQQRSLSNEGE